LAAWQQSGDRGHDAHPRITKIYGAVYDSGIDHEVTWPASGASPGGCAGQALLMRAEVTQVEWDGAM
jgi:hypothetical protein